MGLGWASVKDAAGQVDLGLGEFFGGGRASRPWSTGPVPAGGAVADPIDGGVEASFVDDGAPITPHALKVGPPNPEIKEIVERSAFSASKRRAYNVGG